MLKLKGSPAPRFWSPSPESAYLGEMTDEDFTLGFRYREIASATPIDSARRIVAAVYYIDVSNRIVRIHDPVFNRPGYVHQCFGVGRRSRTPAWHAVQLTFPDAKMALRSWVQGKDNRPDGDPLFPHIEGLLPTSAEY